MIDIVSMVCDANNISYRHKAMLTKVYTYRVSKTSGDKYNGFRALRSLWSPAKVQKT